MKSLSYLAFAAGYRRISFVLIEDGLLATWHTSNIAAKNPKAARDFACEFINLFQPTVIVMEKLETTKRKGRNARQLLEEIQQQADQADAHFLTLEREKTFRNRQAEAAYLASLFPEVADKVPRRDYCENEPHHMVLFEALALAQQAIRGGPTLLARNM